MTLYRKSFHSKKVDSKKVDSKNIFNGINLLKLYSK